MPSKPTLSVTTCGTCRHFKGVASPKYGQLCVTQGVRDYAKAPESCYNPEPCIVKDADIDLAGLGAFLQDLTPKQLVVVGELLKNSSQLHDLGLRLGQRCYVCIGTGSRRQDYVEVTLLGAEDIKSYGTTRVVYCTGKLLSLNEGRKPKQTLFSLLPDSLIVENDYLKKEFSDAVGVTSAREMSLSDWVQAGMPKPTQAYLEDTPVPCIDSLAPVDWKELLGYGSEVIEPETKPVRVVSKSTTVQKTLNDGTVTKVVKRHKENAPLLSKRVRG